MKKTAQFTKNIPLLIFVMSLTSFVLSQLIINSILAPLGTELQSLNREKNFLVEENRTMEEQIAKANSITVVHKLADKALSLSTTPRTTIYLEKDSLVANR
ncbi:MAG TPA: hypothetical protein PLD77_00900 [Candidatus Dojkabacteria bacterium]|mgnify:CR=1 FL=1|nr:hypothetical protein [Candidatus Dojkabacteria bacterium]